MAAPDAPNAFNSVWTGFVATVAATPAWFFVIAFGTDLTNDDFLVALAYGAAFMALAGLGAMIPARSRRFGLGVVIGAPLSFVVEVGVLVILVLRALS